MKLATIALALVAALALPACNATLEDFATDEEIAQLDELDAIQADAEERADALRDEIKALAATVASQASDLDAAALDAARLEFLELEASWRAAAETAGLARDETVALEQEIAKRANPLDAILGFLPEPYRGPAATVSPLFALLFKRVRSNAKKTVRSALDGAWLEAARGVVASTTPFAHSNGNAEEVTASAIHVAKKQGKTELAELLEAAAKAAAEQPTKPAPIPIG